ncbi:membrane protein [Mycolicibacter minnesotensis]|nr:membrane protein [Mycolicibacter minnesotensis]
MRLPDYRSTRAFRVLQPVAHSLVCGPGLLAPGSVAGRALRWTRTGILILVALVSLQSLLLVAGAWRNDITIERDMGVAAAEVLNAGFRRSTIEFVTPERITYRPELGVLYPSELATGMRIYVEYDKSDPDLVRVQHRTAVLAVIPAGSVAVLAWLIGIAALAGCNVAERRWAAG